MNEELEAMIDGTSLANVLEHLAEVCREKAEHVQSNWQDDGLAAHWETQAKRNLVISKDRDPVEHIDSHAGVHLIRRYYPGFVPLRDDFSGAYWGAKSAQ